MLIDVCVNSHIPDDIKGKIFEAFFLVQILMLTWAWDGPL